MVSRTNGHTPLTAGGVRRPDFVDSLAKGLQLLAAFERDAALSNAELADLTALPKATVSRLTGTLVTLGYLQRDEDSRKYVVGARVLGFGASLQRHMRLQRAARPLMQALADRLDISIVLGTRDGTRIVLLEVARPPHNRLTVNNDIGSYVPLATTAMGLAYLVAAPVNARARLLAELQRSHVGDWAAVRERVERAHAERERQRFVVSMESRGGTLGAVGVPLVLDRGRVFTFSAVGPAFDLSRLRLTRVAGPALVETVDRIALGLGGAVASAVAPARARIRALA